PDDLMPNLPQVDGRGWSAGWRNRAWGVIDPRICVSTAVSAASMGDCARRHRLRDMGIDAPAKQPGLHKSTRWTHAERPQSGSMVRLLARLLHQGCRRYNEWR